MVKEDGHLIEFKPTKRKLVEYIRLLSASFARSMVEYAEAEGLRYQFDGPTDIKTKIGWSDIDGKTRLNV
jgi:hypothetical protein